MIPLSSNFPPIRVTTKPANPDSLPGAAHSPSIYEAAGLSLGEATELLDWLENHQIKASQVEMDSAGRVTVRWPG
ncbi:MAG: hypothetical protein J2P46_00955 [Zavarzinella sp.]|nr:hypothetical protein [Zavarzinella sp.]